MPSLFPEFDALPRFPRNACVAGYLGKGPAGETCGTCAHRVRIQLSKKGVSKCGLMRHHWTNGGGTDIRVKWPACEKWTVVSGQ
ncbi:MAG TPA: hypothetical protein VGH74_15540 [Planctomycetaceae bacterium]|jgi:hypothetical protein